MNKNNKEGKTRMLVMLFFLVWAFFFLFITNVPEIYASHLADINATLIDWWSLNETLAINQRNDSRSGIVINTSATTDRKGNRTDAMQFNGSANTNFVNVSWYNLSYANFSWQAWIYMNDTPVSDQPYYVFRHVASHTGSNNPTVQLFIAGDCPTINPCLTWQLRNDSGGMVNARSNITIPINAWTHIAGTYNNDTKNLTLYVNGTQVNYTNYTSGDWSPSLRTMYIGISRSASGNGAVSDSNTTFNGSIDDFAIWNSVLSGANISYLYNNGTGRTYENITGDLCGVITSNTTLDQNVIAPGTCFTIGASNIFLDGNGFTITGNTTGAGISSTGFSNITIRNFAGILNFTRGIDFLNVENSSIFNNTIVAANVTFGEGIRLENSNNNNISTNTINTSGTQGDGISISTSLRNNITLNRITPQGGGQGIFFGEGNSNGTIIKQNTFNITGTGRAIYIRSSHNFVESNTIIDAEILLEFGAHNNTFLNNNITAVTTAISDSTGNNFTNYLIYNNTFGEIRWTNDTNDSFLKDLDVLGEIGLGINLFIGNNTASLNTSAFGSAPKINSSANITLYGLNLGTVNQIRRLDAFSTNRTEILNNGANCNGTSCEIVSYNATTGVLRFNTSFFSSHTGVDTVAPAVTNVRPIANNFTPQNSVVNISANVTGIGGDVDSVLANVTYPNNTTKEQLRLAKVGDIYNYSFGNTTQLGTYNITFIANDTAGNINATEKTNFTVEQGCGTISANLILTKNLMSNGTCFNITASNIFIDGNGFTITGNGSGLGVLVGNVENVSIRNFGGIVNYSLGIIASSALSFNITISNNTIRAGSEPGSFGINLQRLRSATVTNNTVTTTATGITGIFLGLNASSSNITANNINTTGTIATGIGIDSNSSFNNITDNNITVNGSSAAGIAMTNGAARNLISSNTIFSLNGAGVSMTNANSTTVENNRINASSISSAGGIFLNNASHSELRNNTLLVRGINLVAVSENNTLVNNNFSDAPSPQLTDSTGSTYINYFVYNNSFGEIRWTNLSFLQNLTIDVCEDCGGIALGTNLFIGNNTAAVNSSAFDIGVINSSANITFYGLNLGTVDQIRRLEDFSTNRTEILNNGANCNGTSCAIISYNATTGVLRFNTSFFSSHTGVDTVAPIVTNVRPVANNFTATNSVVNISANVTGGDVDIVLANVTYPNNTTKEQLRLVKVGDIYNFSFGNTSNEGYYNVTFIANDTSNNINSTEKTNFTVDSTGPAVATVRPVAGSSDVTNSIVNISATVTDQWLNVDVVLANVTYPDNATKEQLRLARAGNIYNFSFGNTTQLGNYNITFIANDTAGNLNTTQKTNITIEQGCGTIITNTTITRNLISNGTCFTIAVSNIFLDGNGFTITGNGSGSGIEFGTPQNITLRGFGGITNFSTGILGTPSDSINITIRNNTITGVNGTGALGTGIQIEGIRSVTITNNTIITSASGGGGNGIVFYGTNASNISSNIITVSGLANGIQFSLNSTLNNVTGNTITATASSATGISVDTSLRNQFDGNTINAPNGTGISLFNANSTIVAHTYINVTGTAFGIFMQNTSHAELRNNSFVRQGISMEEASENNTLLNNNFTGGTEQFLITDTTGSSRINYFVYNNTFGEIRWTNTSFLQNLTINVSGGIGLGTNLFIGNNTAAVNSSAFNVGLINSSTNITLRFSAINVITVKELFRLEAFSTNTTFIQQNGTNCNGTSCFIIRYNASTSTLFFNTTFLFSSYAAKIDSTRSNVTLEAPPNSTTNTTNSTPTFRFNVTDDLLNSDTLSCTLRLNNTATGIDRAYGTNNSVLNKTSTNITANETIPNGNYLWRVECSDSATLGISEQRNITIDVSECGNISSSVTMNRNLTSTGTCFTVRASNIALNCAGFSINYSTAGIVGYAVNNTGFNNVTVRNCNIFEGNVSGDSKFGISLTGVVNNTIENNTLTIIGNLTGGISVENSNTTTFNNNTLLNTGTGAGIIVSDGSSRNTLAGNNINYTGPAAVGGGLLGGILIITNTTTNNIFLNNNISASNAPEILDDTGSSTTNFLVYNNSFGQIRWTNTTFLSNLTINVSGGIALGTNTFIGNNIAAVNSSAFDIGVINSSANITLAGLSFTDVSNIKVLAAFTTDSNEILTNGTNCNGTSCFIINYNSTSGILLFNTTSLFSSFATVKAKSITNISNQEKVNITSRIPFAMNVSQKAYLFIFFSTNHTDTNVNQSLYDEFNTVCTTTANATSCATPLNFTYSPFAIRRETR